MLVKYSKQDDPPSQSKLAVLYEKGAGVEQDDSQAMRWYQRAAAAGDLTATNNIGFLYFAGQGVERNIGEALRWFVKAAELGSIGAMDNIGEMYARGIGVEQSDTEALQWFRKAAERGHAAAACKVGWTGAGVQQDNLQAYVWLSIGVAAGIDAAQARDAAASKLTPAQVKEANDREPVETEKGSSLYGAGRGVAQDNVQAYVWLSVGMAAGIDATQSRDAIAAKMTPAQIKQADLLVSQWKPLDQ